MIATREAAKHVGLDITAPTVARAGLRQRRLDLGGAARAVGAKIVAVTDWKGGVYNDKRLDVDKLIGTCGTQDGGRLPGAEPLARRQLFASTSTS
jgi:glutamate dehydrogenase/leucine dehydrogenase